MNKKVCLLGDFAVGKTSLVRRLVYSIFEDKYLATIGVKVSRKSITLSDERGAVEMNLMLWDLAGSEEFTRMRASYLRGAAGAVLVCDLTRPETLPALNVYVNALRDINAQVALVIAANKCDLEEQQQLSAQEIENFATNLAAPFYLTSAKEGTAVTTLFEHLCALLLQQTTQV
ncbi:MAG TPA: Rab family GTPase [Anaerolineae bacterium]|nr:Rab family GTPase [Anaerolineae bacterium]HQI84670.1 Rab family GTPase [Anaerolineae bacterium]